MEQYITINENNLKPYNDQTSRLVYSELLRDKLTEYICQILVLILRTLLIKFFPPRMSCFPFSKSYLGSLNIPSAFTMSSVPTEVSIVHWSIAGLNTRLVMFFSYFLCLHHLQEQNLSSESGSQLLFP